MRSDTLMLVAVWSLAVTAATDEDASEEGCRFLNTTEPIGGVVRLDKSSPDCEPGRYVPQNGTCVFVREAGPAAGSLCATIRCLDSGDGVFEFSNASTSCSLPSPKDDDDDEVPYGGFAFILVIVPCVCVLTVFLYVKYGNGFVLADEPA